MKYCSNLSKYNCGRGGGRELLLPNNSIFFFSFHFICKYGLILSILLPSEGRQSSSWFGWVSVGLSLLCAKTEYTSSLKVGLIFPSYSSNTQERALPEVPLH